MNDSFNGFSPNAVAFFEGLAANNTKAWFEAHRSDYEKYLLEPLKSLVIDLSGVMLEIDPDLITIPAVDKTISRIYRDTRFSRNKSPYKTRLWISFKRPSPDWKTAPCFFFEISADGYRYGMGFYSAMKETMDRLRRFIETEPARFRETVVRPATQDTFTVEGERYKRPLNTALPDDLQRWHGLRNLYFICNRVPDGRLFSRGILEDLRVGFGRLSPLYHLLWRLRV